MFVEDPKTGNRVRVDDEQRLWVDSVIVTLEHHTNQQHGEAYNALFAVGPEGADDCIFYLKNNDIKDLIVESIWWQTSAAEEVYYKLGDTGAAVKTHGADITPANLNVGSGNIADVTCYSNTADSAVDITGLSGGATAQKLWLTSAASVLFNCDQDIIVPKNQTFTIYCVDGDTYLRGTVTFHFHSID